MTEEQHLLRHIAMALLHPTHDGKIPHQLRKAIERGVERLETLDALRQVRDGDDAAL